MFCGSLNITRHVADRVALAAGGLVESPRLAVDACGPLIVMWRAAFAGWVPPRVVSKEEDERIKATQDPHDPMTAFVLFGCSFGGKWCGGYAKDRPEQRYAECASNGVVKKARDCRQVRLEHATFQSKHPGCWPPGTVLYCDPPYRSTTGYKAVEPSTPKPSGFRLRGTRRSVFTSTSRRGRPVHGLDGTLNLSRSPHKVAG